MRARYYSTDLKRFVNEDTVLGGIMNGQSLNRFAYVNGNPVMGIDPLGKMTFSEKASYIYNTLKPQPLALSDEAGNQIKERWAYGDGSEWNINNNAYWSNYMKDNSWLTEQVKDELIKQSKNLNNGESSNINLNINAIIGNGCLSWTGYDLLHGTNGGLDINGTMYKDKDGITRTKISLGWNDRIDPNPDVKSDQIIVYWIKKLVPEGTFKDYNIKIHWNDAFKIEGDTAKRCVK